jgi:folate-binding protein YgfZ
MRLMLAVLTDRAVIRLKGPDWRSFLQGLITQDVETLRPGDLRYGALLTPQGRLRLDLFLHGEADGVALDVAASEREALAQALTLYRLRAKVDIQTCDTKVLAAWGDEPPRDDGWRADPRLPALGWRRLSDAVPDAAPDATISDYRAHRIALGVADPAEDAVEPLYPIEANLDLLNGIDFKKGCFIGQETTSRMKRRGQVKTRIAALTHDGPSPLPAGLEVDAGDLRAGRVLSGIGRRSLALLRIDRALNPPLRVGDQPVALDVASWLAWAFALEKSGLDA